jgi:hypothetical protein
LVRARKDPQMSTVYVLVVLAYGNYSVTMHDFSNLQACVNASAIIERAANNNHAPQVASGHITTMCLPKR